jgi:CheY-like chemotaxis protein
MQVVGQMVSGVAHDLANILTAIQGFSELAADGAPDHTRAVIREIQATANRGTELARKLLAVGRARDTRASSLDLNTCVAEVETLLRRVVGPDLEIRAHLDLGVPRINAVVSDIEMVLLNLVLNARDAIQGPGWIEIRTGSEPAQADEPWPHVVLSVSDSGTGMDEETLERVFEPFFTTKEEGVGTGLGLAVVADVIRDLGGHISVASALGRGTTFTIRMPAPDEISLDPGPTIQPDALGGTETLLLCDDDPGIVRMLASALRRVGYSVVETHGPHEAIAAFHERDGEVDLLVSDVMMPELTGEALLAQLRMGRPGLKAVLLTGYTEDGLQAQGVGLGDGRVLQKPFGPEELRRVVREVLDG